MNNNASVIIKKILFNDNTSIELNKDDIVLFVGANNAGKSRILKDIRDDLVGDINKKIIIKDIEYMHENFYKDSLLKYFNEMYKKDNNGTYNIQLSNNRFQSYDKSAFEVPESYARNFYSVLFTFLSTENRLKTSSPIIYNQGILDYYSLQIMNCIENNQTLLKELNDYLFIGYKKGINIYNDYYYGNTIRTYKVGDKNTINQSINSLKDESNKILKGLLDFHEQGDGIRSAFSILSSLIANHHSLFLIDEPETFLHPPQAKLLGNNIVELSKDKQCFISTHNIELIKGILEKNPSRVKIIKIDRDDTINHIYTLNNADITKIANNKNLKYTNILNGLFYNQIVLCENESDCKFYASILENVDKDIFHNTLFCAVGGKDQFKMVIPLIKLLNINYKILADLDLIDDEIVLSQLLNSIDETKYNDISKQHKSFINLYKINRKMEVMKKTDIINEIRKAIKKDKGDIFINDSTANNIRAILKLGSCMGALKEVGIRSIQSGDCMNNYIEIKKYLNSNSIYILECGIIENFVKTVDGHGIKWVDKTFDKYPDFDNQIYDEARDYLKTVFDIK